MAETNTNGFTPATNIDVTTSERQMDDIQLGRGVRKSEIESEIAEYFDRLLSEYDRTIEENSAVHNWREVARVIDKVFFIVFFTITTTATIVLLVICPTTKDLKIET